MSALKVALVVLNDVRAGGAYGYEATQIRKLFEHVGSKFDVVIYSPTALKASTKSQFPEMKVKTYRNGLLTMFMLNLRHSLAGYKLLKTVGLRHGRFERSLIKESVSLVYFLSPNPLALDLVDTPMITTVWDLGHRDIPEFVEISGDRHYEEREFFFRQTIPKSFRVIVDTGRTAERIQAIYGALENRIIVQGLGVVQPAVPERINSAGSQFFLYPAQFWPHKNHLAILEATSKIKKKVNIVFCGAKKNFYYKIIQYIKNKKITNIKYLGVVNDDELIKTYNLCSLVVVPTKEESSCMLLKESFALKKNLLVSNTEVFKEYSKLFKLNLFDLKDNNDLQKKIANIYFGKKKINKINYNYKKVKLYTWQAVAKKFMELTL